MRKQLIKQARQANLVTYLIAQGHDLRPEGGGNYRLPGHGGLVVRGNHWQQFSTGDSGNAIDLLVRVFGMDFQTAVGQLTTENAATSTSPAPRTGEGRKVIMPQAAPDQRRVIAYLTKTRGLPALLVVNIINEKLLYQDQRGNCVFVCYDHNQKPRGAIIRGTLSDKCWRGRAAGSNISYPWWWPPSKGSDLVTICESPIDALSLAVLRPGSRQGHLIALGGLHQAAVESFVGRGKVRRVVLALDSDVEGRRAARAFRQALSATGIKIWNLRPHTKDWNSDLFALGK